MDSCEYDNNNANEKRRVGRNASGAISLEALFDEKKKAAERGGRTIHCSPARG